MIIAGIQKLTLIDYPGKLACVVFTQGCPFRCPFCHNPELIDTQRDSEEMMKSGGLSEEEFFSFLDERKGKLEGVVITGGEPTIQKDLPEFISKIKERGFLVKLDSNGTNSKTLEKIIDAGNIDYIAMDIKQTPEKYHLAVGTRIKIENIKKSIELIMNSGIEYEFRTTVVPTIHEEEDFLEIAKWIKGAKNYFLQEYRDTTTFDKTLPERTKGKALDLEKIKSKIEDKFEFVGIRSNV